VLAQSAALIGIWGLTFIAVAVFASPAVFADDRPDSRRPWLPMALGIAILAALATYGAWRLGRTPTAFVDNVRLRIMQPNLQQDDKFNYSAKQRVMSHYLELSDRSTGPQSTGVRDATHLIWPESAFPFLLTREPDALAQIAALIPEGTVLITGAVRAPELPPGQKIERAYNSIYVIDHDGSILSVYDKIHLVPFGEYLPFQDFLEKLGLMQLTKLPGGFIAGERRRPMPMPRAPRMLPFLCYEIIFPGETVPDKERPGWLLNLTNDGWFGISSGPYQHLQQARVRTIEQGLPLVRAANTGISVVIDPLGRIVKSLPLGTEGIMDASLPRRIEATLYARTGDSGVALVIGAALIIIIRRRVKRR
jgi:apolipoprotein N-acyltransferase